MLRLLLPTLLIASLARPAVPDIPWQPYHLRGSPFSLLIPPGAVPKRDGPPKSAGEESYTLRETYGESETHGGIVIPLRHGFLSAVCYHAPDVYGTIAGYLAKHKKARPWGRADRGSWHGMPTLTAGWVERSVGGQPLIAVDFVVERAKGDVIVLSLSSDESHLDEGTPYFVKLKESLTLAGDGG